MVCCSGHENGGAFKPAGAEIGEGLVGLAEWVARDLGDDADLRGQTQEIESILPREILPVKADSGKLSKPTFLSSRLNPMRPAASPERLPRPA